MSKTYKCSKIAEGRCEAPAVISKDAMCFYMVEHETGLCWERNHDMKDRYVCDRVLIMPSGKGSSVVQGDGLYRLMKSGKNPRAIIVKEADTVLVSACILMEVPMVHKVEPAFYEDVKEGDQLIVDADKGEITIL